MASATAIGLGAIWLLQIANVAYFNEAWPFMLFIAYYMLFAFVHFANFLMVLVRGQEKAEDA